MFPLRMEELEIYGDRPPVGTDVACRITIHELERHRVRVEAQIVRPDGTVWMRINDWEDWRFHWPGRYRDSFRQPRDYLVGEELPLDDPAQGPAAGRQGRLARTPGRHGAARLARRAGTHPARARGTRELSGSGRSRRAALAPALGPDRGQGGGAAALGRFRRVRRPIPPTWRSSPTTTAEPRLTASANPTTVPLPAIAIADAEGVAVALAALDPRPGSASPSSRSPSRPRRPRHSRRRNEALLEIVSDAKSRRVDRAVPVCQEGAPPRRRPVDRPEPAGTEVVDVRLDDGRHPCPTCPRASEPAWPR